MFCEINKSRMMLGRKSGASLINVLIGLTVACLVWGTIVLLVNQRLNSIARQELTDQRLRIIEYYVKVMRNAVGSSNTRAANPVFDNQLANATSGSTNLMDLEVRDADNNILIPAASGIFLDNNLNRVADTHPSRVWNVRAHWHRVSGARAAVRVLSVAYLGSPSIHDKSVEFPGKMCHVERVNMQNITAVGCPPGSKCQWMGGGGNAPLSCPADYQAVYAFSTMDNYGHLAVQVAAVWSGNQNGSCVHWRNGYGEITVGLKSPTRVPTHWAPTGHTSPPPNQCSLLCCYRY